MQEFEVCGAAVSPRGLVVYDSAVPLSQLPFDSDLVYHCIEEID